MTAAIKNNGGSQFDIVIGGIVAGTFDGTGFTGVKDASITQAKLATEVQPLGVGQTWQSLTGSRTLGVTYTNSTGRPITVVVDLTINVAGNRPVLTIDGTTVNGLLAPSGGTYSYITNVIPAGTTYVLSISAGGGSINNWQELR